MTRLVEMLRGGDRRSIGEVPKVVALASGRPDRCAELVGALRHEESVVRMRAADALEKLSATDSTILHAHKEELLRIAEESRQKEVRWHLAQMLPRLELGTAECHRAKESLIAYLDDESRIVQTFALQGLVDLVGQVPELSEEVRNVVEAAVDNPAPSVRTRARKLLASFE